MFRSPGKDLISLCHQAKDEVLLVAPFIKVDSLSKIFASIPPDVEKITVITRWIPKEIATGVSDLEVFDLIAKRKNARLHLHPCLHAKYYRADNKSLVGSANLTATALGWCPVPNIELLVEVDPETRIIQDMERHLSTYSIVATEALHTAMQIEVDALKLKMKDSPAEQNNADVGLSSVWLPTCNKPEYLYKIYSGQNTSTLLSSVVKAGELDINALNLLPGMSEESFEKYISAIFESTPVTLEIQELTKDSGATDDAAEAIMLKYCNQMTSPIYDSGLYWSIFKKWMMYFFPNRYRIRAAAEVLEMANEIR